MFSCLSQFLEETYVFNEEKSNDGIEHSLSVVGLLGVIAVCCLIWGLS